MCYERLKVHDTPELQKPILTKSNLPFFFRQKLREFCALLSVYGSVMYGTFYLRALVNTFWNEIK